METLLCFARARTQSAKLPTTAHASTTHVPTTSGRSDLRTRRSIRVAKQRDVVDPEIEFFNRIGLESDAVDASGVQRVGRRLAPAFLLELVPGEAVAPKCRAQAQIAAEIVTTRLTSTATWRCRRIGHGEAQRAGGFGGAAGPERDAGVAREVVCFL